MKSSDIKKLEELKVHVELQHNDTTAVASMQRLERAHDKMTGRKLASIQAVAEVRPIEGADRIVAYRINDWLVVDGKDKYKVGDLVVYFEIDSLLPMNETFEFLAARGSKKSELEDGTIVEGYRLKTIKLKGQVSQGLAMPLASFDGTALQEFYFFESPAVGDDVTSVLGVHKYEKPMNAQLRGVARGNFPSFARKSDQERCQNLRREIWDAYVAGDEFQVTVKLDGSSMTIFNLKDALAEKYGTEPRFGVCSRNLELKESEGNAFWEICKRDGFADKTNGFTEENLVFQGELIAPNIQSNFEGVSRPDFYVYNVFDIEKQEWFEPGTAHFIATGVGFKYVPIVHEKIKLSELFPDATEDTIIEKLLAYAEGPSAFGGKTREGLVYKRVDGKFSFKTISTRYLMLEE